MVHQRYTVSLRIVIDGVDYILLTLIYSRSDINIINIDRIPTRNWKPTQHMMHAVGSLA